MFRAADHQPFSSSDLQSVFLPDLDALSPTGVSPSTSFPTLPQDDQVTLPDLAILNEDIPSPSPPEKPKPLIPPAHPVATPIPIALPAHASTPPLAALPTPQTPHTPLARLHSASPPAKTPLRKRRDHHNTHTRRCRARLNSRFDSLSRMLPPSGTEPRQKVHILDRAIEALGALHADNERLARTLALRSPSRMLQWVHSFTRPAANLSAAVAPLARLVCELGAFPYAELWARDAEDNPAARLKDAFLHAPPMLHAGLSGLADATHGVEVPVVQLADAVFERGCATWFGVTAELHYERRARLADARVRSGFAVPLPVGGRMTHALVFYDVKERQVDAEVNRVASFGAVAIGNYFGCPIREGSVK